MTKLLPWVMLPSGWINEGGLKQFRWGGVLGSNAAAALMVLVPILHKADRATGIARVTYNDLELATSLSRTKIAAGLAFLEKQGIIQRSENARSTYVLSKFDPSAGWAKFPALKLYREGRIAFFDELNLRKRAELDALKLWYLFAARRDKEVNIAKVTYDQIEETTGIARDRIKSGLSMLAANGLIHVEQIPSRHSDYGIANAYRLPQIDSSRHMGSTGRGLIDEVTFGEL